jgi:dienelactone hydrolase
VRKLWAVLAVSALLAACGTAPATASRSRSVTRPPSATRGKQPRVFVRTIELARGPDRPLPTTIWYPARLEGRHPIVLFSHGLGGLPEQFAQIIEPWAASGYIVAAPAYPHTNGRVAIRREDIVNQPADAAYVLDRIREMGGAGNDAAAGNDARSGNDAVAGQDVFAGHVDASRIAVVGFSAGGTTTLSMLAPGHDPAIKAAVCIAGREPATPMGGPIVATLFLHGDADPVVPIAAGRAAYAQVPWPSKRFVTIPHTGHGEYLHSDDAAYARTQALIVDFLNDGLGRHAR